MNDQVTESQAAPAPNLTVSDLLLVLQTLQVVAQRGAIKAEEMTVVGGLHDRLYKFLDSQGAIASPPAGEAAETEPAAAQET